jgi:DNA-binding transcriptional MerR regulator
MPAEQLTIGDLARATDTKVETVRYYERIGILPAPARTRGNYRAYTPKHLDRLSFIRRARSGVFAAASSPAAWLVRPTSPLVRSR